MLLLSIGIGGCRTANQGDHIPHSKATDRNADQLNEFAKQRGVDLYSKLQSICAGNTNALADVFKFSLTFTNLDDNAKSCGQLVHGILGTLVNMGYGRGDWYAAVVAAQDLEVKQRVRDLLYYSIAHESANGRMRVDKEIREEFPNLFPPDYRFGEGDPLFRR